MTHYCIIYLSKLHWEWDFRWESSKGWALAWPGVFFNQMSSTLGWFQCQAKLGQSTTTAAHGLLVCVGFSPCGSLSLLSENQAELWGICWPTFGSPTASLLLTQVQRETCLFPLHWGLASSGGIRTCGHGITPCGPHWKLQPATRMEQDNRNMHL